MNPAARNCAWSKYGWRGGGDLMFVILMLSAD